MPYPVNGIMHEIFNWWKWQENSVWQATLAPLPEPDEIQKQPGAQEGDQNHAEFAGL